MELYIVLFFNHLQFPYLTAVTTFVSNEIVLVILCGLSLSAVFFQNQRSRLVIMASVLLALLLHFVVSEWLLKHVFVDYIFRARPFTINPTVHQIGTRYTDSSFPSSHMASTCAVITVYFYHYRKYLFPIIFFILLMAFARIHNGMHYPSDVIAGLILGVFYGSMSIYIVRKICKS